LQKFAFGSYFIEWIKIFYKNAKSQIKINGELTDQIEIERGLRQGCPLSALLYVLCAEVLHINIRKDPNIKGYLVNKEEIKGLSYADDMMTVVTTDLSIEHLFNLIEKYEQSTNAKINIEKTEALWVGKWATRIDKPNNLKWVANHVKFVGVHIGNNRDETSKVTFSESMDSIKYKLSYWNSKYISIKGKVKVVNTFILSKLWYFLEIQDLNNSMLIDLKNIITSFIWKGHKQVSYDTLCLPYLKGGLSLPNIQSKMEASRVKWLTKLLFSKAYSAEKNVCYEPPDELWAQWTLGTK